MSADYLKKLGRAVRNKRGQRGYRQLAAEIHVSPATISRCENGKGCSRETDLAVIMAWLGMSETEIEAIELPPEPTPQSEAERTAPICFDCKTPLENVGPTQWNETQAVERMVVTEDDGWMEVVDETFTVHAMSGYCPKCKRKRTQDWYSGLWW